jgi:hypothetical protein
MENRYRRLVKDHVVWPLATCFDSEGKTNAPRFKPRVAVATPETAEG